jgi:hypothetical protein
MVWVRVQFLGEGTRWMVIVHSGWWMVSVQGKGTGWMVMVQSERTWGLYRVMVQAEAEGGW